MTASHLHQPERTVSDNLATFCYSILSQPPPESLQYSEKCLIPNVAICLSVNKTNPRKEAPCALHPPPIESVLMFIIDPSSKS